MRSKKHALGRRVHPRHISCATVWNGRYVRGVVTIKRLTYKDDPDYVLFETNTENGSYDIWDPEELEAQVHRLWQIEDILGDEYDLDWLREVVEKERAKQTVYPPFWENQ